MSNDITQGFLNIIQDDSSAYPQAIAGYEGNNNIPVTRQSIYGLCSMPPAGSSGLIFKVDGMTGVRRGIFDDVNNRFKNLSSGEVQLGNYGTQTSIKFDKDGNVTINVPSGDLTINATNTIVNGNMEVTGDITANNFTSLTNGFNFNSHFHIGDDGGNTSNPVG